MNTVLFDLDGTILALKMELFYEKYFGDLENCFKKGGIDTAKVMTAFDKGFKNMFVDDGIHTNKEKFFNAFSDDMGEGWEKCLPIFDKYYDNEFLSLKDHVQQVPQMIEAIKILKEKGYTMVVATSPLFPRKANDYRIEWAGIDINDFEFMTTYEYCKYVKPSENYYKEVLAALSDKKGRTFTAKDCLMVGNDMVDDMGAAEIGIPTYIINENLYRAGQEKTQPDYVSDYNGFLQFVKELPNV